MISQAVNGIALNPLRGDVFIAVYAELAGRRIKRIARATKWDNQLGNFCEWANSGIRFRRSAIDKWIAEGRR